MAEKTIPLSRRYDAHGGAFDSVTLRAPKLRDHIAIGDPVEVHRGPDGDGRFVVEHLDRVAAYLDRLAVPGKPGRECLDDLDLADSIAIKDAVTDFFMEARERLTKPTSLSSGPASPSPPSAT
jgi:hypothetical protein